MPYQYILANLLAEVDEALGVVFVDEEGETIDVAARNADVDLRVTGAYLGIYAQRVVSLAEQLDLGRPSVLYIERQGMTLVACILSGGYSLAIVQDGSHGVGRSSRSLLEAASDLEREVLA